MERRVVRNPHWSGAVLFPRVNARNNVDEQILMKLKSLFLGGFILIICKALMKEKNWKRSSAFF